VQPLEVIRLDDSPGGRFAARELRKYLTRATGTPVSLRRRKRFDPQRPVLWLGTSAQLAGAVPACRQQVIAPIFGITHEKLEARP